MNQITTFPKIIAVEFRKSRHKHSFLLLGAAIVLNYFFLFYGISPDRQEWYNVLYGIPVINTLILTVAAPAKLVKDKWLTASLLSSLSIVWIAMIYLITGKILGLPGNVPERFWIRMVSAVLCLAAIAAVQGMLSIIFHSFAVPIALDFAGSIAGLELTVKGAYYASPYSMLIYGMGSTSITGELNVPVLLASCCFYILGAMAVSVLVLKRMDVRTQV